MAPSTERVYAIFKRLEDGDGSAFCEHVADDVDWTVMGTHPLRRGVIVRLRAYFDSVLVAQLIEENPISAHRAWLVSTD
jgi:ketosteroid isomerase-like protein